MTAESRPLVPAASLLLGLLASAGCSRQPDNVVLLTLDTTRADYLGAYGRESARTPNIDRLAATGYLFERAYTSNPVTQPAHSTILTGVYPMAHGVRDNLLFRLPSEQETLAEILSSRGYATGAAIGGFPLTREFGTDQGFDFYDDDLDGSLRDFRGRLAAGRRSFYDERPAAEVNDAILPWLRDHAHEPFFVWLHYWDPHLPHIAPPPYGELFSHDPYQGEIAYADQSFGMVLRELEALGVRDRTLVVVTADHGEGRGEHGELTHAFLAYDTTLRVPLVLNVPGMEGGARIAERVGTVDIVPTVLDLLGFESPAGLHGRSLRSLLEGRGDPARRYYAESLSPRLSHGAGELRVLYDGPYKYIHGPRPELFDLDEDSDERRNLLEERPRLGSRAERSLAQLLSEHAEASAEDAVFAASEETRERLEALGYIATGDGESPTVVEKLTGDGHPPQDRVGDINLALQLRGLLSRGEHRLALSVVRQLLAGSPDSLFLRAKLAASLAGLGQLDEAEEVVEATGQITPANVDDYLIVAERILAAGRPGRALEMASRLVAAQESPERRLLLSGLARRAGDIARADSELRRALELNPKSVRVRLELADANLASGKLDEAEAGLRALLSERPLFAAAHLSMARLMRQRGDLEPALDGLDRTVRIAPGFCDAHLERLDLLAALGRPRSEALAEMRRWCPASEVLDEARAPRAQDG